jgi:hypothetical protein
MLNKHCITKPYTKPPECALKRFEIWYNRTSGNIELKYCSSHFGYLDVSFIQNTIDVYLLLV